MEVNHSDIVNMETKEKLNLYPGLEDTNETVTDKETENAIKECENSIKENEDINIDSITMEENPDENKTRGNWSNKYDYLLSLAGIAIGMGNVWRFPYLCYKNGGGAFLVPYFTMLAVIGIPMFFLEVAMGQFASTGCISLYKVAPGFKGVGYTSAVVTLIASSYYSILVAYPLVFLWYSMASSVPWATCDNEWNTGNCHEMTTNFSQNISQTFEYSNSAADEFFHNKILDKSSGISDPGTIVWPVTGAVTFVWIFTFFCIFKGIKVVGKVVWFTATFPYVMLLILFIRGVTLEGAWTGIKYYMYPDLSKIFDGNVWIDAAQQIFFSSGIGWGTLVTLGSYNRFHNDCISDALFIPILNCATSVFAGFVVFSVLGFMSHQTNLPVDEVATSGLGLAFIAYPTALAQMPMAPLWAVLFFAMLFFLGIDSLFVQVESIVVSLMDEHPRLQSRKTLLTFIACVVIFCISISCCTQGGIYVVTLLDQYSVGIPITITCLFECIIFVYFYGAGRVVRDIQMMTKRYVNRFTWFVWICITPTILVITLIMMIISISEVPVSYYGYIFPNWTTTAGWFIAISPLAVIPGYWLYHVLMVAPQQHCGKSVTDSVTPSHDWGPALPKYNAEWKQYCKDHPLYDKFLHPGLEPDHWGKLLVSPSSVPGGEVIELEDTQGGSLIHT